MNIIRQRAVPAYTIEGREVQGSISMLRLLLTYLAFVVILIIYGAQVGPFFKGLEYLKVSIITIVPVIVVFPFRAYAFKRTCRRLEDTSFTGRSIYGLPWRELKADLFAWLTAGLLMAAPYLIHFKAPLLTEAKILLGCLSFGLFGGTVNYLYMEKKVIGFLKSSKQRAPQEIKRSWSVSSKMLLFTVTLLSFMVLAILSMVFLDIDFLLTHRNLSGPEIYSGVFKDILFAFAVLLGLSLIILRLYAQNLKQTLDVQVDALEGIEKGDLSIQVPVVSNDEFGQIAVKTNEMIRGLKERAICRSAFGKYVAPEVSEKILAGEISLEGEMNDVSILFCDIRGFTNFVERKEPKEVVGFLNSYFSEMEKVVKQYNGIVLQYIGDEIEAVFGAPIHEPEHPEKAVMAALEMRKRLRSLNERRENEGEETITHGIGIHTGRVLAGSIGSPERLTYSMVGDAVNTASRLQALNKTFGTDILISDATRRRLPENSFEVVSLGEHPIKGKSERIEIFRVIEPHDRI
jgi:adenylate cyclase